MNENHFNPKKEIFIGNKKISKKDPVYFIAEIGSNFDQDINRAKDLIYLAKDSGADAAKFQHYTAMSLVSDYGFKALGKSKSHQALWEKSVYNTYDDASLNIDWTQELKDTCDDAGITFFTSPYAFDLVDFVDKFVPAYKIGSGDITWISIIEHIASKMKPVLLATGASTMKDVNRAVKSILKINNQLILMQCNTNYTADSENYSNIQLRVITTFRKMFPGILTGLSDHMPGHVNVLGAVALGVKVIEKHFTDSTKRHGPDHPFSMTPKTWTEMVERTRELESALGHGKKKVEQNEKETIVLQQRSICSSRKINKYTKLKMDDLNLLRPCPKDSIKPYEIERIIGKKLNRDLQKGEIITWQDLD